MASKRDGHANLTYAAEALALTYLEETQSSIKEELRLSRQLLRWLPRTDNVTVRTSRGESSHAELGNEKPSELHPEAVVAIGTWTARGLAVHEVAHVMAWIYSGSRGHDAVHRGWLLFLANWVDQSWSWALELAFKEKGLKMVPVECPDLPPPAPLWHT